MKTDKYKLDQLRKAVEETFGRTPGSPTDFDRLSYEILSATSNKLGVSTLKRFWGYINSPYNATYTTLSVLARYAGFRDWDAFCSHYKVDDSNFSTTKLMVPASLKIGAVVKAEWASDKSVKIKKIADPNRFEVMESTNIKLQPNDTLSLDVLIVGEKLIATDCRRATHHLGTYIAARNQGIASILIS